MRTPDFGFLVRAKSTKPPVFSWNTTGVTTRITQYVLKRFAKREITFIMKSGSQYIRNDFLQAKSIRYPGASTPEVHY